MISKHLVELHDGRLTVDNTDNGGACFTVTLPTIDSTAAGITLRPVNRGTSSHNVWPSFHPPIVCSA